MMVIIIVILVAFLFVLVSSLALGVDQIEGGIGRLSSDSGEKTQ